MLIKGERPGRGRARALRRRRERLGARGLQAPECWAPHELDMHAKRRCARGGRRGRTQRAIGRRRGGAPCAGEARAGSGVGSQHRCAAAAAADAASRRGHRAAQCRAARARRAAAAPGAAAAGRAAEGRCAEGRLARRRPGPVGERACAAVRRRGGMHRGRPRGRAEGRGGCWQRARARHEGRIIWAAAHGASLGLRESVAPVSFESQREPAVWLVCWERGSAATGCEDRAPRSAGAAMTQDATRTRRAS